MRQTLSAALVGVAALAQPPAPPAADEFRPKSILVVPQNLRERAKFPFVDVHGHPGQMTNPDKLAKLISEMDEINLRVIIDVDADPSDPARRNSERARAKFPDRFAVFTRIDFGGIDDPAWSARAAAQLRKDVSAGAAGLTIPRTLGISLRDAKGRLRVDDPRLDPVWEAAGKLQIPVLVHSPDPSSYLRPGEGGGKAPSQESVAAERRRVFNRHPATTFIEAHLAWNGHNLAELGRILDEMPNVNAEIGAAIAELGRQPRFARQWLIRYQNRILFGKGVYDQSEYRTFFRVLETADEYFDHYRRRQGYWQMYGMDLPDEVLRKIYYKNALRLIPAIPKKGFPQ
jgi:predicted TIM-barrel fold metal-dependent hydrolase